MDDQLLLPPPLLWFYGLWLMVKGPGPRSSSGKRAARSTVHISWNVSRFLLFVGHGAHWWSRSRIWSHECTDDLTVVCCSLTSDVGKVYP